MAVYEYLPHPSDGSETLLWTNGNPSTAVGAFNVSLSEAASNFKRLRITVHLSNANATELNYEFDMTSPSVLENSSPNFRFCMAMISSNNVQYIRTGYFNSNAYTEVHFSNAYRINTSGNNTAVAIPIAIYGIK